MAQNMHICLELYFLINTIASLVFVDSKTAHMSYALIEIYISPCINHAMHQAVISINNTL